MFSTWTALKQLKLTFITKCLLVKEANSVRDHLDLFFDLRHFKASTLVVGKRCTSKLVMKNTLAFYSCITCDIFISCCSWKFLLMRSYGHSNKTYPRHSGCNLSPTFHSSHLRLLQTLFTLTRLINLTYSLQTMLVSNSMTREQGYMVYRESIIITTSMTATFIFQRTVWCPIIVY